MSELVSVRHDPDADVLDRLRDAAGADFVMPPELLPRYPVAGVVPRAVVAPESVAAAARTLALCSERGWPVEPAGAGTWLFAGAPPREPPVVISTARLHRIHEYEPANLVVGVEAGMPLDALAGELASARQAVPLDPPAAPGATIGAAVAHAAAGPLRALHGTPRDMVIGVEFIAGDGRVLRFGGRVVKNVAGYDIVRLITGSRGAFGLLTSLFIRLRAAPDVDTTAVVGMHALSDALELAAEIRRRMTPDALEVMGPGLSADALSRTVAAGQWAVLVRLRGGEAAVGEAVERLGDLIDPSAQRMAADAARPIWQAAAESEAAAQLCFRVADLPASIAETVAATLRLTDVISASDNDIDGSHAWRIGVHAADGIVRAWLPAPPDHDALARLATALTALAAELAGTGGTVTWPAWPAGEAVPRPVTTPGADIRSRLIADLKARFDPAGILSPGRHVLGS